MFASPSLCVCVRMWCLWLWFLTIFKCCSFPVNSWNHKFYYFQQSAFRIKIYMFLCVWTPLKTFRSYLFSHSWISSLNNGNIYTIFFSRSLAPSIYLSVYVYLSYVYCWFTQTNGRTLVRWLMRNTFQFGSMYKTVCSKISVSLSFFLCQHVQTSLAHQIKFSLQHHFIW